ncbi:hypothetical protein OH76DRAFT_1235365 [Lentinus brumalis]|uniref:Uncharacterized protein n=1 Tax=Lentinus brumalis TaxID=2498619 RepID=A0A371CS74_9APHY|nr:hypothetical protein OH76DRAFT_1235365 [Polyporus brumalis]
MCCRTVARFARSTVGWACGRRHHKHLLWQAGWGCFHHSTSTPSLSPLRIVSYLALMDSLDASFPCCAILLSLIIIFLGLECMQSGIPGCAGSWNSGQVQYDSGVRRAVSMRGGLCLTSATFTFIGSSSTRVSQAAWWSEWIASMELHRPRSQATFLGTARTHRCATSTI